MHLGLEFKKLWRDFFFFIIDYNLLVGNEHFEQKKKYIAFNTYKNVSFLNMTKT